MNASFSGHYICYVKNIQNKWFNIDDTSVNDVELESVLTKGAYMLLYARCSPRAPKLIRNSTVPHDPRKSKNLSLLSRSHSTVTWNVTCTYSQFLENRNPTRCVSLRMLTSDSRTRNCAPNDSFNGKRSQRLV